MSTYIGQYDFYSKVASIPSQLQAYEFHPTYHSESCISDHFSSALLPVLPGVGDGGVALVERGRGERHFDNSLLPAADDAGSN